MRRRLIGSIPLLVVVGLLVWLFASLPSLWHRHLDRLTGSYDTPGLAHHYNFWSGFGSVVIPPLITLAGVMLLYIWHQQCHTQGCYWPARRKTAAGDLACWLHHPERPPTIHELHLRHHRAKKAVATVIVPVEPSASESASVTK